MNCKCIYVHNSKFPVSVILIFACVWLCGVLYILYPLHVLQVKEAESRAIVEGIRNNSEDNADIVIRKVR